MSYGSIAIVVFVLTLISDVVIRLGSMGLASGLTELVTILNYCSAAAVLVLTRRFNWRDAVPSHGLLVLKIYIAWGLISLIHGLVNIEDYWDLRSIVLSFLPSILISLMVVIGVRINYGAIVIRFMITRLLIIGFVFLPFSLVNDYELYPRVVISVSMLILFAPYLKFRWKALIFATSFLSLFMDLSYRTNSMRILFSALLLSLFFNQKLITSKVINFLAILMLVAPLVFLVLGITGKFNVFQENLLDIDVVSGSDSSSETSNISVDTRTLLYREVFSSMTNRNQSFVVGAGGGASYESLLFSDLMYETQSNAGRYGSEVGFLNQLLYSGVIGVLLYALILYLPIYYAINHSNNRLCKILGLYLAFHWVLFFVEDRIRYDMNFFCLWLVIGLCLSNNFRSMSEAQIKRFFEFAAHPSSRLSKNEARMGARLNR